MQLDVLCRYHFFEMSNLRSISTKGQNPVADNMQKHIASADSVRRYLLWNDLSGNYRDDVVKPLIKFVTGKDVDLKKAREDAQAKNLVAIKHMLMSPNPYFSSTQSNKVKRNAAVLLADIIKPRYDQNQIFNALRNVRRLLQPDLREPFVLPPAVIKNRNEIDADAFLTFMEGKFEPGTGAVSRAYKMALINRVLENTKHEQIVPFRLNSRVSELENLKIKEKTLSAIKSLENLTSSQKADLRAEPAAYAYNIVKDANTENLPGVIKAINYMQEITSRAALKDLHAA